MSTVLIQSIQGVQNTLFENNGFKQSNSNVSYIKVTDLDTGKILDWKLGVFTQGKGEFLTQEEAEQLNKDYGFMYLTITPYEGSNDKTTETAISLLKKLGYITEWDYECDEADCRTKNVFDGFIVIGEIELEKAKELSKKYSEAYYVY